MKKGIIIEEENSPRIEQKIKKFQQIGDQKYGLEEEKIDGLQNQNIQSANTNQSGSIFQKFVSNNQVGDSKNKYQKNQQNEDTDQLDINQKSRFQNKNQYQNDFNKLNDFDSEIEIQKKQKSSQVKSHSQNQKQTLMEMFTNYIRNLKPQKSKKEFYQEKNYLNPLQLQINQDFQNQYKGIDKNETNITLLKTNISNDFKDLSQSKLIKKSLRNKKQEIKDYNDDLYLKNESKLQNIDAQQMTQKPLKNIYNNQDEHKFNKISDQEQKDIDLELEIQNLIQESNIHTKGSSIDQDNKDLEDIIEKEKKEREEEENEIINTLQIIQNETIQSNESQQITNLNLQNQKVEFVKIDNSNNQFISTPKSQFRFQGYSNSNNTNQKNNQNSINTNNNVQENLDLEDSQIQENKSIQNYYDQNQKTHKQNNKNRSLIFSDQRKNNKMLINQSQQKLRHQNSQIITKYDAEKKDGKSNKSLEKISEISDENEKQIQDLINQLQRKQNFQTIQVDNNISQEDENIDLEDQQILQLHNQRQKYNELGQGAQSQKQYLNSLKYGIPAQEIQNLYQFKAIKNFKTQKQQNCSIQSFQDEPEDLSKNEKREIVYQFLSGMSLWKFNNKIGKIKEYNQKFQNQMQKSKDIDYVLQREQTLENIQSADFNFTGKDNEDEQIFQSQKPWTQRFLVIYPESWFYKIWQIIVLIECAITAILYPFSTLNEILSFKSLNFLILMQGEVIMLLDILINMVLAYKDDDDIHYVTNIEKIRNRYIYEGSFMKDVIIWIPFTVFNIYIPQLKYLQLIKAIRFQQLLLFIDKKKIMPIIRGYFENKSKKLLTDPVLSEDKKVDHNQILNKLIVSSVYNITKYVIIICITVYICTFVWIILVQLFENYDFRQDFKNAVNFFTFTPDKKHFAIYGCTPDGEPDDQYRSYFEQTIIYIYFGLTTMATVGLGDYYPISDTERVLGIALFLIGSIIFSLLMGVFIQLLKKFLNLDIEFDDSENLNFFFQVLAKFNLGAKIDQIVTSKIIKFFEYKWKYDKNNCVQSEEELYFLDQMPKEVQQVIFRKFLYHNFLIQFRRLFQFQIKNNVPILLSDYNKQRQQLLQRDCYKHDKKNQLFIFNKNWFKFKDYPFYDWNEPIYANFMIDLLKKMEARFFDAHEVIYKELEECNDIIFVQKGSFNIGYEINNQIKMRYRFGPRNSIGCFNVCFHKRSFFHYQAHSQIDGVGIRKNKLLPLFEEFPHFKDCFFFNSLNHYDFRIRRPLIKTKNNEISQMKKRKDFEQLLYLQEDPNENSWFIQTRNQFYQKNVKIKNDRKKSEYSNLDQQSQNQQSNDEEKMLENIEKKLEYSIKLYNQIEIKLDQINKINEQQNSKQLKDNKKRNMFNTLNVA